MKAAQDRQKFYADKRRIYIEFSIDDKIFVKVSPLRKVVGFGTLSKLASRFIGPYKVKERVGKLAYQVRLPTELAGVHDVFHVSHFRKYLCRTATLGEPDEFLHVATKPVASRAFVRVIEHRIMKLRNKEIKLVRV